MINERDAIRATEGERVVGFNAITCGAAFHVWNVAIETMRLGETIELVASSLFVYFQVHSGRCIRFSISLKRGSERRSSSSGATA